jgi:chromosome segregation ATPase
MTKRARLAAQLRCNVLRCRTRKEAVMVGLVLTVFLTSDLLMRAGNVESNPGPGEKEGARTVQTRLTAAGGRSASAGADRRCSASKATAEPTMGDLMAKLTSMESSMNNSFEQVRADLHAMKGEVLELQAEVQEWKEKVSDLERETAELKYENEALAERVSKLEDKTDDLEGRSRRNNILVHGLDRVEGETAESLELRLTELFTDKLDFAETVEMDRVHRLGSKAKSPIIARCTFYKDKVKIMKCKKKLHGSDIFIGDDFSKGVREKRKLLSNFLKEIKQSDKDARMVHDHIVSQGKKFFLGSDKASLVER